MKQETLEEVAKEFFRKFKHTHIPDNYHLALVEFSKLQSERMYSEEEVLELLNQREWYLTNPENIGGFYITIKESFEQFKKK